ncbi:hypothetical protein [Tessaracoccus sp. ZS01]|uniref:hypothetical protein n=1 Tax=Tessaracoccus sp. ZS01 TaxID=1906324 RepID=UPI00096C649B|nr:hypothetical protein [Tessaracoccus sp. ZS01]MCG6566554.1 hypothetical protein [Tessaracoccus sp. ZS01]OMG58984.1 hypothetical protein BJN44_02785 [Tessaracoccus sp. ZS01]
MSRLFWMLLGIGLTIFVMLRGRELLHKLTPRGMAEQVEKKGHETAAGFGDFMATFRRAMAEREAELRRELDLPETPSN